MHDKYFYNAVLRIRSILASWIRIQGAKYQPKSVKKKDRLVENFLMIHQVFRLKSVKKKKNYFNFRLLFLLLLLLLL